MDQAKRQRIKLFKMFESLEPEVTVAEFKGVLKQESWSKAYKLQGSEYLNVSGDDLHQNMSCSNMSDHFGANQNWNASQKEKNAVPVREACFSCPCATVSTSELARLIINDKSFGVEHTMNMDIPDRLQLPDFTSLDVWVNKKPDRISYAQLKLYYNNFYKFSNLEKAMDDMFWNLQQVVYKKLDKSLKKKKSTERLQQLRDTPVAFLDFYHHLYHDICHGNPDNWMFTTDIGKQWQTQAQCEKAREESHGGNEHFRKELITWLQVFTGIWSLRPQLDSLEDAKIALIASKNQNSNTNDNIDAGAATVTTNPTTTETSTTVKELNAIEMISGNLLGITSNISSNIQAAGNAVTTKVQPSSKFMNNLKDNFHHLIHSTKSTSSKVVAGGSSVVGSVSDSVSSGTTTVANSASSITTSVGNATSNVANNVSGAISTTGTAVANTSSSIITKTGNVLHSAETSVVNAGHTVGSKVHHVVLQIGHPRKTMDYHALRKNYSTQSTA